MEMPLSHHYHAIQALSPTAARLAARLLDLSVGVPFEWRLSLRMALVERGRLAPPFNEADLAPLRGSSDAAAPESPTLDQAYHFIRALCADPTARREA